MMLFCLAATTITRYSPSVAAFGVFRAIQPPAALALSTSQLWEAKRLHSTSYSAATTKRLKGLDALTEFEKLSTKLNKPPKELRVILGKRLEAALEGNTSQEHEKAEYLDWLLSSTKESRHSTQRNASEEKPKSTQIKNERNKIPDPDGTTGTQTFATDVTFADRTDLHSDSKRAIQEVMGLTSMTEIQAKTFEAASSGRDVLGRARTGTGKTVAFLLPAIERILRLGIQQNDGQVGIVVVSPTRELATQIADQAEKLITFHRHMSVQVMYGGTNMNRDVSRLKKQLPTILVATPGRLLDHLQSTKLGNLNFGTDIMSKTPLVVLDETDRLLDMGFRREIQKILGYLPPSSSRQTLLFSATIPADLKTIMAQNMKKDYVEVDCINDGDAATHTNVAVQQSHVVIPSQSDRYVSSVVEIVRMAWDKFDGANTPAKIVIFFPTARLVNFFAELFNEGNIMPSNTPVLELHSKKTQSYRNRVSEKFRAMDRGILFTSDVSARGKFSTDPVSVLLRCGIVPQHCILRPMSQASIILTYHM